MHGIINYTCVTKSPRHVFEALSNTFAVLKFCLYILLFILRSMKLRNITIFHFLVHIKSHGSHCSIYVTIIDLNCNNFVAEGFVL